MNNEFIPKELEQDMIDLGMTYKVVASKKYNGIPVNGIVEEWTVGILYSTAFRFFREKYGYIGGIRKLGATSNPYILGEFYKDEDNHFMIFGETYEDCELKSLKELIEIAKKK